MSPFRGGGSGRTAAAEHEQPPLHAADSSERPPEKLLDVASLLREVRVRLTDQPTGHCLVLILFCCELESLAGVLVASLVKDACM